MQDTVTDPTNGFLALEAGCGRCNVIVKLIVYLQLIARCGLTVACNKSLLGSKSYFYQSRYEFNQLAF